VSASSGCVCWPFIFGVDGYAAGQGHVQAHVGGQHLGGRSWIANLDDTVLRLEGDALAAQVSTQIVHVEHTEGVALAQG
jgi:hypothetical protein